MNNKILNKQIPIETVISVANKLEDYKERYEKIFEQEELRNKNLPFGEKNYEYENGRSTIKYTIEFQNGRNITESDYNWFIGKLNEPRAIKRITLDLSISYIGKSQRSDYNNEFNKISVYIDFRDAGMNLKYSDASVEIETTNQEKEANNIYSEVMNILEDNEDRYNKTIKHRKIRMQCFTISVGIILSYILFIILKVNIDRIPKVLVEFYNNKYFLILGQWFIAILFGNVISFWYIMSLYRPLLPESKYAGYNSSTYRSVYKDDVKDYTEHSEIHFGKFWDADKRRNMIEKIYKITSKVVLAQLVISILLYFILK